MELAFDIARWLNALLFIAIAAVAGVRWTGRRDAATGWFALTFIALSTFVAAAFVLPEEPSGAWVWIVKMSIAILALVPYLLFRFIGSFVRGARWLHKGAAALTALIVVWSVLLPPLPESGEPLSRPLEYFLLAFLFQWTSLSLIVTLRAWRAGARQPTVARRRMRLLGAGALVMALALISAGVTPGSTEEATVADVSIQWVAFASACLFLLGFAPPAALRMIWRRPEADALGVAISELMGARTREEVSNVLLPRVAGILGARGAALLTSSGRVIGSQGASSELLDAIAGVSPDSLTTETHDPRLLILAFPFGYLAVWVSAYTPFFGREEIDLIRSLGALTEVALGRASLLAQDKDAQLQLEAANRELADVNEALARNEAMLSEAQEVAGVGSWEWEIGTDTVRWSEQLYRIFGVTPTDFGATYDSYLAFVHPEDREHVQHQIQAALENRSGFSYEARIVRPNGDVRTVYASGKVSVDATGRPRKLVGAAQDVTDRKETEKVLADALSRERIARIGAERANTEQESFVYSVSHDLNSPLISITGYLDYLQRDHGDRLPDEGRHYIERALAGADYMRSLIRDLLELSRVGRVETEPEEVPLSELITEIGDEVGEKFPGLMIETGSLPVVSINRVRARQLFANLIENSAKYSHRSNTRVFVTADKDANGLVCVSVADNGPGIAEKNRERIFGVFERAEASSEGSGIGLAVCKRIAETNGGRIWIEDSEKGTDMRVTIPVARGANGADGTRGRSSDG